MDSMSYRNNRPAQRPSEPEPTPVKPEPATPATPAAATGRSKRSAPAKKGKRLLLVALCVGLLAAILVGLWLLFGRSGVASTIDGSKYQVVVLRDGLSTPNYFGKLTVVDDNYLRLTNVFYLKEKESSDSTDSESETQDASDFELIKLGLGGELHGPEDVMIIPTNQVLYFENLKSDGAVSKAIAEFENKDKQ